MTDVLLVCVSDDAEPAEALAQRLESEGFSIAGVTSPSDAWGDCRAGVILWSPASTQSGAFLEVAQSFISARKAIIVSTLEGSAHPVSVDGAPFIDLSYWDGGADDPALDDMCAAIDRLTAPSWRRWLSIEERQEPDFVDIYMARRRGAALEFDQDPGLELIAPQSYARPDHGEAPPAQEDELSALARVNAANENAPPPRRRGGARMMLASAAIALAALAGSLQFNSAGTVAAAPNLAPFAPAAAYAEPLQALSLQDVMAERVTIDDAAAIETAGWRRGVEPASMPAGRAVRLATAMSNRDAPAAAPRPASVPMAQDTPTRRRIIAPAMESDAESAEQLNQREAARLRDQDAVAPPLEAAST